MVANSLETAKQTFVNGEVLSDLRISPVETDKTLHGFSLFVDTMPFESECSGKLIVTLAKDSDGYVSAFIVNTVNHTIQTLGGYESYLVVVKYYDKEYNVGMNREEE